MSKIIATPNSTFHADDVIAVATLLIIEPEAKIIRTRDENVINSADYVVDVGLVYDKDKKRFDHHQVGGAGKRENGIEYASFGLVWKEYGEKIAGGIDEARIIEKILAEPLDAHDNGMPLASFFYDDVRYFTMVDFLYSYLPKDQNTEEELYKIFTHVVDIAKNLILREVERARIIVSDQKRVREIYKSSEDKRIIILDREYSWVRTLMEYPEPLFAIYPRADGKWSVKGVPESFKVYGSLRKRFPSSWGGKTDKDLAEVSGVNDAVFAHRGLFMAVAMSKEGAVELANKAINA